METIKEAKAYLRANHRIGVKCPCCNQLVKLYDYKLNTGMAKVLIAMYMQRKEWVHPIKDLKTINGDYAKLRFWDLVEKSTEQPEEDKKATGFWRITERGKQFVRGEIKVKAIALLYDNKCWGLEGADITIQEALGNKFDYAELMRGNSGQIGLDM